MTQPAPILRRAVAGDLPAVNAIFNHYITHSSCIFHTEPVSLDWQSDWLDQHNNQHPVFVACIEDTIVGWAALSAYSGRCGYRHTAEISVYVHHDHHRQGIGGALLQHLIDSAKQLGHHTLIALITADQQSSLCLHAKLGFERVGQLNQVGRKFDRWLDVIIMQHVLS